MKKENVIIAEGNSFEHLIIGMVTLSIGIISIAFLHWLAIIIGTLLLISGVIFLLGKSGIEVDYEQRRIRKFKMVFTERSGLWNDLSDVIQIELVFNPQLSNQLINKPANIVKDESSLNTYDVILMYENGYNRKLNNFVKYGLAKKTLEVVSKFDWIKTEDHFHAMLVNQRKNRFK